MRAVSYAVDGEWRAGIVVESDGGQPASVVDAAAAAQHAGLGGPSTTVRELCALAPGAVRELAAAAASLAVAQPDAVLRCADLRLGAPIPDPEKIVCLGLNYSDHAAEAGLPVPPAPMLFAKYRNSLIGSGEPLFLPTPEVSDEVDYEGELAAVIGRVARDVDEGDALSYVAGYTVLNDISARDLQSETGQWLAGKSLDGFAPCGPVLVTADEIPDPQALMLTTRVNGRVVQHASTGLMIYSVASAIAFISRVMTLVPGDVIATGTPAGVGSRMDPPVFLAPGDTVDVEIEGIGTIATPIRPQAERPELAGSLAA
jgi:2-keto-4-pentenoate hydratase/2-oxohepta-3-ene-1,7-dioic acid hydratase in catechol pathway